MSEYEPCPRCGSTVTLHKFGCRSTYVRADARTPSDADTPLTPTEVADIARFHEPEVHRRQSPNCHVCALLATLDATRAPAGIDVERLADDVRYADGNGTSDYWRGFNDGIDKLAARLRSTPDAPRPETL